jgi:hypothetical protein
MKILLHGIVAFTLAALTTATTLQAAEKSQAKESPKTGESYSGSGTVAKNEVDICMIAGLRWMLHPESGEEVKIYPKTKHAAQVLEEAVKNHSSVRVMGTWKQAIECHYVETSKVTTLQK